MRALRDLPRISAWSDSSEDALLMLRDAGARPVQQPLFVDLDEDPGEVSRWILQLKHKDHDPLFIVRTMQARLAEHRSVVTRDGRFLGELWNHTGIAEAHPAQMQDSSGMLVADIALGEAARHVPGRSMAFFFHPASGQNHSHFLVQTLPQLAHLAASGMQPDRLLVLPDIRDYQYEMLAALGWPRERILVRDPSQTWLCDELYTCYVPNDLPPARDHLDRLRAHFGRRADPIRRVYVSRQDARHLRRFLNEDELVEGLRGLGFTALLPSLLSAAEEVQIFRDAKVVVGPLGAGLYNTLFADPGSVIIGLSDPRYLMWWLPQTAALAGADYGLSLGTCFLSREKVFSGTHNNWFLDVPRALRRIAEIAEQYDPRGALPR